MTHATPVSRGRSRRGIPAGTAAGRITKPKEYGDPLSSYRYIDDLSERVVVTKLEQEHVHERVFSQDHWARDPSAPPPDAAPPGAAPAFPPPPPFRRLRFRSRAGHRARRADSRRA